MLNGVHALAALYTASKSLYRAHCTARCIHVDEAHLPPGGLLQADR